MYFSITDNGEIKGQIVKDSTIKMVVDGLMRDIEPKIIPSVTTISYEGNDVIKVTFSGAQKPYSAFGNSLISVGITNRKMIRDELIRLVQSNNYSLDWENKTTDYTFENIDKISYKCY